MSRSRTYAVSSPGTRTRYSNFLGTIVTDESLGPFSPFVRSICDDAIGVGDHPLNIDHVDLSGMLPLNGAVITSNRTDLWGNYYSPLARVSPGIGTFLSLPSIGVVATAVVARSNPSRPYVSIPNFIYELKDLPAMIRDIGRLKLYGKGLRYGPRGLKPSARDISNHYLSSVMGWSPLIQDLRKLIKFQEAVSKRVDVLDRLFNKNGGLHRTVGKPNSAKGITGMWVENQLTTNPNLVIDSVGPGIRVRSTSSKSKTMWGSVRWTATSLPPVKLSRQELSRMARNLVFGLNVNPEAIWDAIPWSWMIDWYANVGDFLAANHNAIPCRASAVCVMVHYKAIDSWSRIDGFQSEVTGGTGTLRHEMKQRSIQSPTLTATIPFLSDGQLSILSALAIQRFSR